MKRNAWNLHQLIPQIILTLNSESILPNMAKGSEVKFLLACSLPKLKFHSESTIWNYTDWAEFSFFWKGETKGKKQMQQEYLLKKKKTMPLSYLPGGWDLIFFERTQRPAIECTLWIRGLNLASLSAYSNGTNSLKKGIKSLSTSVPGCGLTLKLCK